MSYLRPIYVTLKQNHLPPLANQTWHVRTATASGNFSALPFSPLSVPWEKKPFPSFLPPTHMDQISLDTPCQQSRQCEVKWHILRLAGRDLERYRKQLTARADKMTGRARRQREWGVETLPTKN